MAKLKAKIPAERVTRLPQGRRTHRYGRAEGWRVVVELAWGDRGFEVMFVCGYAGAAATLRREFVNRFALDQDEMWDDRLKSRLASGVFVGVRSENWRPGRRAARVRGLGSEVNEVLRAIAHGESEYRGKLLEILRSEELPKAVTRAQVGAVGELKTAKISPKVVESAADTLADALQSEHLPLLLRHVGVSRSLERIRSVLSDTREAKKSPLTGAQDVDAAFLMQLRTLKPEHALFVLRQRDRGQHNVRAETQHYLDGIAEKDGLFQTIGEMRAFAEELKALLCALGDLRVRCLSRGCGKPAILRARVAGTAAVGVFQFGHPMTQRQRGSRARNTNHGGQTTLPRLQLIPTSD